MKHSFLIAVVILAFSTAAYGIKCYMCTGTGDTCSKENLEGNKDKYLVDCSKSSLPGLDQCGRSWIKPDDKEATIENSCANKAICDLAKTVCDNYKDGKCAVDCCKEDACNAATPVSFSLFLMTVCSVFGLIFLK